MAKKRVVIAGFGFSGLILARELIKEAPAGLRIMIYDKGPLSGKGYAYATDCPLHLLNVPAIKMSAFSDQPTHFFDWLLANQQSWRRMHTTFQAVEPKHGWYCPRMIYGKYLEALKEELISIAEEKRIVLRLVDQEVVSIQPEKGGIGILDSAGSRSFADAAVLATGVPLSKKIANSEILNTENGYISGLYPHFTDTLRAQNIINKLSKDSIVALIGGGLTMLDALATLKANGFKGRVLVFSSKGLIPASHSPMGTTPHPIEFEKDDPPLREILRTIRTKVSKEEDWRPIIDGLRPSTQRLWNRLSLPDKKKFMRHLFNYWNIHRHRAPPETTEIFLNFKKNGLLRIEKKSVTRLDLDDNKQVLVTAVDSQSGATQQFHSHLAINCTGPDFNILKNKNDLIVNILKSKIAAPDPLNLGFSADGEGRIAKEVPLYAMGSLLLGSFLETTAVPEIRKQAFVIAKAILKEVT